MNLTAIDVTTRQSAPVYGSNGALQVSGPAGAAIQSSLVGTAITGGIPSHNHTIGAATTNAKSVKTSTGQLEALSGWATTSAYLKIYDKATAPTVGTDVPILTMLLPANQGVSVSFAGIGLQLANGLAMAITLNPADTDATALAAAGTCGVDLFYA
jgi:hypothetical protein